MNGLWLEAVTKWGIGCKTSYLTAAHRQIFLQDSIPDQVPILYILAATKV